MFWKLHYYSCYKYDVFPWKHTSERLERGLIYLMMLCSWIHQQSYFKLCLEQQRVWSHKCQDVLQCKRSRLYILNSRVCFYRYVDQKWMSWINWNHNRNMKHKLLPKQHKTKNKKSKLYTKNESARIQTGTNLAEPNGNYKKKYWGIIKQHLWI